jgi:hypothetical protein
MVPLFPEPVINLASHDWFDAFNPKQARDPDRGFRHP